MTGYWWLGAKAYLKDRLPPRWVNRDACIDGGAERFADTYAGLDRALNLKAKPHFDFSYRERRPRALTPIVQTLLFDKLGPAFLLSAEFAALITGLDAAALNQSPCDVTRHGRPSGDYVFADVAHAFDGRDAFERAISDIVYQVGFAHDDGRRSHAIEVSGAVRFVPETVGARDLFWVNLGWSGARLAVSDRLAEAIFARGLLGLMLEDATGTRRSPPRFQPYTFDGWEDLHPA
ncbi:imm11 family protein [Terricaulis sp.]|uniref:imm11 family protein n=1 Tax=Terricaulis sp. TaxID=2768686 RepID=UPI0037838E40